MSELHALLEEAYKKYNKPSFITDDPISIPHSYSVQQDIEIAGLFAAILAFGQRKVSIRKTKELLQLMDNAPHDFIVNHKEEERKAFIHFVHRTFQPQDAIHFIYKLQKIYRSYNSLDQMFAHFDVKNDGNKVEASLNQFHDFFFSEETDSQRSKKHLPCPRKKSTCKRLNLFLRWMVRKDNSGVDFGLWNSLNSRDLLMPYDVHVERLAKHYGLVSRKARDWKAVVELTSNLRQFDKEDPVKYDYALFGQGVLGFK